MKAFIKIKFKTVFSLLTISLMLSCGSSNNVVKREITEFQTNTIPFLLENIKNNPDDPQLHYQLARAYAKIDSINLAFESIERALELSPKNNDIKLLRADLLLKKNQAVDAYNEFLAILKSETGDQYVEEIRTQLGCPYPIYQLTNGEFNNAFPYYSPDDLRIAFQSDRDGNWELYLMDADGAQEVRLTNNYAQDEMPVFSSKENIIAFTSTRDDTSKKSRMEQTRNIYLMDLQTGSVVREIDHPADDWYPTLADKGREIAFVSERDDKRDVPFHERYSEIYLRDIKNSSLLRLTQNEADDGSPSFSSDGKWIVFTSNRTGTFQVHKMNKRGQLVEQLTFLKGNCGAPHFSHDGKKITFFSDINGNHDVFMMDYTGKNIVQLTNHPAQDGYPSFSADKRKIIFHSNRSGKYQIYWIDLMNPLSHDELIEKLEEKIDALD